MDVLAILPSAFSEWFNKDMAARLLDAAFLVLGALIIQEILLLISGRFRKKLEVEGTGTNSVKAARAKTLTNVLFTSISVAGWVILAILVLDKLGVNIGPLLASAGVVGLAISFGSQEVVKDFIAGFFFLLENQFNTGDIIEVKGKKGRVVDMSFRTVIIRELETGTEHIYRNSLVDVVSRFDKKAEMEALEKKSKDDKK